jgi:hypothetical protein
MKIKKIELGKIQIPLKTPVYYRITPRRHGRRPYRKNYHG